MAKYRVHLGAFVTKDRFTSCYQEDAVYAECGSIEVDSVEEV